MLQFFSYWFWPNPAGWHYADTRVQVVLGVCAAFVVASFIVRFWRKSLKNHVTKQLTAGWPSALFWFGIVGLVLAVSRVETIQFMSMRILWAFWFLSLALYGVFQFINFSRRHYTVLQRAQVVDERDKYLPKKRR